MHGVDPDKKSQVSTFRLPASLITELKKEASYEKVNFNSLVTKILSNHVLWGRYERKVGLLPMTKPFVNAAIHRLEDKEIITLAKVIEKETFSNILRFMKSEYTVNDFIEIVRAWLNVAWMQHNVELNRDSYIFTIQHELGEKWSLYVETLIKELFYDIINKKLEVKSTRGNITLIFPIE
ncbi:MAG: hypothetical protein HW420_1521 [Candidatus Nitrosotenuis sp.]|nr:hypothetical protein [Candidatus Nitrosotenuis sp.]